MRKGFTMIELLMVIVILGILTATALPNFIDFRNEAKAAVIIRNLQVIRVGMRNAIQQARLRCGLQPGFESRWLSTMGGPFPWYTALYASMAYNDLTYFENDAMVPSFAICTDAQIPNPEDRKIFDISASEGAQNFTGVNSAWPANVFISGDFSSVQSYIAVPSSFLNGMGGACSFATSLNGTAHWILTNDTGEVYAGTNTPGIHECNF